MLTNGNMNPLAALTTEGRHESLARAIAIAFVKVFVFVARLSPPEVRFTTVDPAASALLTYPTRFRTLRLRIAPIDPPASHLATRAKIKATRIIRGIRRRPVIWTPWWR